MLTKVGIGVWCDLEEHYRSLNKRIQNQPNRGAWSPSSQLLTTDMQASLSRSNPRRFCFLFFWGYTSNVTTTKFPGFYPKETFVSALSFPPNVLQVFFSYSFYLWTPTASYQGSANALCKGPGSKYVWPWGSHYLCCTSLTLLLCPQSGQRKHNECGSVPIQPSVRKEAVGHIWPGRSHLLCPSLCMRSSN